MVPEPTSRRHVGVDVVRGLALLSMFVAHAAPFEPGDLLQLSDFLTAALFATLVGVGAGMRPWSGPWGLLPSFLRGLALVVVGLLLEDAGSQVVVILVYLGVLTWVMALLRPAPNWLLAVLAVYMGVVSPWLQNSWSGEYVDLLIAGNTLQARVLEVVFVGMYYRVTTLMVWAILGMLAARLFLRQGGLGTTRRQLGLGAVALSAAAVMFLVLHRGMGRVELEPYSGTIAEIVFNAFFALGVLLLGAAATGLVEKGVGWLADMGRMSLTIYSLQVLWLAYLGRVVLDGRPDDGWWTLASLVLGAVALAVTWSAVTPSGTPARGPLEAGVDGLVRLATPRR